MKQNEMILNVDNVFFTIRFTEIFLQNRKVFIKNDFNYLIILTASFTNLIQKKEKKLKKIKMFLVSIIDIEKVLIL